MENGTNRRNTPASSETTNKSKYDINKIFVIKICKVITQIFSELEPDKRKPITEIYFILGEDLLRFDMDLDF